MAQGCFVVQRDPNNPRDINFQIRPNISISIPDDQLDLKDEIEQSLIVLRAIYLPTDPRFDEYFQAFLSAAQGGLVGDNAHPNVALRSIRALKEEISSREGGAIKNRYVKSLLREAAIFGAIGYILSVLFLNGMTIYGTILIPASTSISAFCLLWLGCMAGVWVSYGVRNPTVEYNSLHMPERDRLEPRIRLIFTGTLTMIFGLMVALKVIVVQIGGVQGPSSDQFLSNWMMAVFLGAICGLSEMALPTTMLSKATTLLGGHQ